MLNSRRMLPMQQRASNQGVSPLRPARFTAFFFVSRSANTQTVTGGEVLSRLVGSPILRLDGNGARIVPLLLPQEHTLPFAVALHMSDSTDACQQASSASPPNSRLNNDSPHEALLELHYVLSGSGHLVLSNGEEQPLVPGDSVIVVEGSAQLLAGPVSPQHPQQGQQGHHGGDAASLVTLQVLLPAALLSETASSLDGTFQPRAATGAEHWLAGRPEGHVTQQLASQVLGEQRRKEGGSGLWPAQLWQQLQRQLQESWAAEPGHAANGSAAEKALDAMLADSSAASSVSSSAAAEPNTTSNSHGSSRAPSAHANTSSSSSQDTSNGVSDAASMRGNAESHISSNGRSLHVAASSSSSSSSSNNSSGNSSSTSSGSGSSGSSSSSESGTRPMLQRRALRDAGAYKLPNQTNRLALLFGPEDSGLSLSFALEIFEPNHRTAPHVHKAAHELFFVLAGEGQGFAGGKRFPLRAGDCAVFPPGVVHGIDNLPADDVGSGGSSSGGGNKGGRLYCLQMMTPNESFVEFVHSGEDTGSLEPQDLCTIIPSLSFC